MSNNLFLHEEVYRGDAFKKFNKHIAICGCGAVGSNLADNLARQGFKNFTLIDMDRVELHNINTQVWLQHDVGALKSVTLGNHLFNINNEEANIISQELTEKNVKKLLKGSDLIIDCFDNGKSRSILKQYAIDNNLPCLHGGMYENYAECKWNDGYRVPEKTGPDICDYPLARNVILLLVSVMAEEVIHFCLGENLSNWTITLRDLHIEKS